MSECKKDWAKGRTKNVYSTIEKYLLNNKDERSGTEFRFTRLAVQKYEVENIN